MYLHEALKLHLLSVTQAPPIIVQDEAAGALFHADLQSSAETEGSGVLPDITGFVAMTARTNSMSVSNDLNMLLPSASQLISPNSLSL